VLVTATLESLLLFPASDALVLLFPSLVEPSVFVHHVTWLIQGGGGVSNKKEEVASKREKR
jgi:hypothetical protein